MTRVICFPGCAGSPVLFWSTQGTSHWCLNIWISPKFLCGNSNSQCNRIRVGTLEELKLNEVMKVRPHAGINTLFLEKKKRGGKRRGGKGEGRRGTPFSALCLRKSRKTSVCTAGNEPLSADTGPASTLILYFPASTVRDECYLILPNYSIVVIASQNDWDTSLAQLIHGKCEQTEAQTAHKTFW